MTVGNVEEHELVDDARRYAVGEAGWLGFHLALAAGTAFAGWVGVGGVWPPLWWLLVGVIAGDALSGFRSTWLAVRDWRLARRSRAFRLLMRELDEAGQRAGQVFQEARRVEVEHEQRGRRRRRPASRRN